MKVMFVEELDMLVASAWDGKICEKNISTLYTLAN